MNFLEIFRRVGIGVAREGAGVQVPPPQGENIPSKFSQFADEHPAVTCVMHKNAP